MSDDKELYSMTAFNVGDILKDAFHILWRVMEKTHYSYFLQEVGKDESTAIEIMGNDVIHTYRMYRRLPKRTTGIES